jgi:outer membrane PBP1 activator LpoA protein
MGMLWKHQSDLQSANSLTTRNQVLDRVLMGRAVLLVVALGLGLAACTTTPAPYPVPAPLPSPAPMPAPGPDLPALPSPVAVPPDQVVTPPHMSEEEAEFVVRAALLLPFSHSSAGVRREAQSLFEAAQFALFVPGADHVVLLPKDTGGDPRAAQRVAEEALREGADVIIGPLFGTSVDGVATAAGQRGKPVIAFTNDQSRAGGGVYALGLAPEDEVRRLVRFAGEEIGSADGGFAPTRVAVMAPYSEFGDRVDRAARAHVTLAGDIVSDTVRYSASGGTDEINPPIKDFARRLRVANEYGGGETTASVYQADTILIGEAGKRLLSVAPLLPFNDIDPRAVKFMALGSPNSDDILRDPSLNGAWFAGADPVMVERFANQYRDIYQTSPGDLAPLAYDAVRLVAELTGVRGALGLQRVLMERSEGFDGIFGPYRLNGSGTPERSLAVLEVRNGKVRVIDEPERLGPSFGS